MQCSGEFAIPTFAYSIAALFVIGRNFAFSANVQAAVMDVDVHVLLGETRKLECCSYGISLYIFMEVQSAEAGQRSLSRMADSTYLGLRA